MSGDENDFGDDSLSGDEGGDYQEFDAVDDDEMGGGLVRSACVHKWVVQGVEGRRSCSWT